MAKRFVFKLAPVLRIRKQRENQQRRVVASCLRDVQNCQRQISNVQRTLSESRIAAANMRQQGTLDISWEQQNRKWQESLVRRIAIATDQLRQLEAKLHEARTELADRAKDVKALEKLREKRFALFQQQQRRAEQYETDEIAANMHTRKQNEIVANIG